MITPPFTLLAVAGLLIAVSPSVQAQSEETKKMIEEMQNDINRSLKELKKLPPKDLRPLEGGSIRIGPVPPPDYADPFMKLAPENGVNAHDLPKGLEWGDSQEGWNIGLNAKVSVTKDAPTLEITVALLNGGTSERYYLTDRSTRPFDVIIVSEAGETRVLGMAMDEHFRLWQRILGRFVAPNSAEIFQLKFSTNEFAGFAGNCVLYARGHIPAGPNQSHAKPLSGNVTVTLPGTSSPRVNSSSASLVPANLPGKGRPDAGAALQPASAGMTSPTSPATPDSAFTRRYGWIAAGLALLALAAGIVFRAVLRRRADSLSGH